MRSNLLLALLLAASLNSASSFQVYTPPCLRNKIVLNVESEKQVDRSSFLSIATRTLFLSQVIINPSIADDTVSELTETSSIQTSTRSISGCPKSLYGKPNNCVSTSNIKQLDTYSPPWQFDVSPEEAFARLKGLFATDSSFKVVESDEEDLYLKVNVDRSFAVQDLMEFIVKRDDKVVLFQSAEKIPDGGDSVSDLGANRSRIEGLRKKSGIFTPMGESLGSADNGKRQGVLGQLKSFYGLQSGEGFQDVFDESI